MCVTQVYKSINLSSRRELIAVGVALQKQLDFLRDRIAVDPDYPQWQADYADTRAALDAYNLADVGRA